MCHPLLLFMTHTAVDEVSLQGTHPCGCTTRLQYNMFTVPPPLATLSPQGTQQSRSYNRDVRENVVRSVSTHKPQRCSIPRQR